MRENRTGASSGGRIDFDQIWQQQGLSADLMLMMRHRTHDIDRLNRSTAGSRMPTEWAKKKECWDAIKTQLPELPDRMPDELARQFVRSTGAGDTSDPGPRLSREDLDAIAATMKVEASVWLDVAAKGRRKKILKGKLPEICKTLAECAANGLERRPSVKQARAGLSALALMKRAGET